MASNKISTSEDVLKKQFQDASIVFQKLQVDLSQAIEVRQQLEAQKTENIQVQQEFALLKPENTVYKLIGPVLVQQDQTEARSNVDTRIKFIQEEIKRTEGNIKKFEEKQDETRKEMIQIQSTLRQQQPSVAPNVSH